MTKGVYKYYQVIIRTKSPVGQEQIDGMCKAVWNYIGNISMTDIVGRKIAKPGNLRFRGG